MYLASDAIWVIKPQQYDFWRDHLAHIYEKREASLRFAYYNDLVSLNSGSFDRYFPSRYDERITYDVIVIGSGMGGGILANETSNLGLKTLVLEAGPIKHLVNVTDLPVPNQVESFDSYEKVGATDLRGGVSFNLGGRSVYWSAVIPRMQSWELSHWPEDVSRYLTTEGYALSEKLFRKRTEYPAFQNLLTDKSAKAFADYTVTHLPRSLHQPDSVINRRSGSPDERSTGVFSTAALLADSLVNSGKSGSEYLHIAFSHLVDIINTNGTKASSVTVLDLKNGSRRIFSGKTIVLACGTTESVRLALSSNIIDSSGLLGVGLSDHLEADVQITVPKESAIIGPNDQGNVYLIPAARGNSDRYSCELALNYKFWDVRIEDDDLWNEKFSDTQNINSTIKFLFRNPLNNNNRITITDDRYSVHIELLQKTPLHDEVRDLSSRLIQYFNAKQSANDIQYYPHSETFHLAGSMRMGFKGSSVVDTYHKFHEYDNLYCCDLSVFPDIPASNPSLTMGALAPRLAHHLANQVLSR